MKSWATPMDEALMTCLFDTGVLDWLTRTNVQPCDLAPILHWRTQFRSHILGRSGRIVLSSRTGSPSDFRSNQIVILISSTHILLWHGDPSISFLWIPGCWQKAWIMGITPFNYSQSLNNPIDYRLVHLTPPNYAIWFKLPPNIICLFYFSMHRWSF